MQFAQVSGLLFGRHSIDQIEPVDQAPADHGAIRFVEGEAQVEDRQLRGNEGGRADRGCDQKFSKMRASLPLVWKKCNRSEQKNQWEDHKINQRVVPGHHVGVKAESESDQSVARKLVFAGKVHRDGDQGDGQDGGECFG
ncbi:MAG: hypothetical protein DMF14_06885 [Verrucomicrobia bacterium]|nr:MAG: hypothetical protein DMF23_09670 [Verrucomicrobiota bacterium]PYL91449.1 MAG: hypothetical protein DMF14_06885 [Verrucomicrobiota bacterium]